MRRVRRRVGGPTTAFPGRAGAGTDDDKGSDYAQSDSEEEDDDDDDVVEVSDYEEDGDEVAEAKKGTAKAAPARARRARNPAAGACMLQHDSHLLAASVLTPCAAQARKAAPRRRLQRLRLGAPRLRRRVGGGSSARRSSLTTTTTWRMSWRTCLRVRRALRRRGATRRRNPSSTDSLSARFLLFRQRLWRL